MIKFPPFKKSLDSPRKRESRETKSLAEWSHWSDEFHQLSSLAAYSTIYRGLHCELVLADIVVDTWVDYLPSVADVSRQYTQCRRRRWKVYIVDPTDLLLSVEVDGNDKSVQTQDLGEDENEDHTDVEAGLLGCAAHAGVADNADSVAGG